MTSFVDNIDKFLFCSVRFLVIKCQFEVMFLWLYSSGYLCAVQAGGERCEHPADPAALHLPGPDIPHGLVLWLSLYPLCYVQERTGTGRLWEVTVIWGCDSAGIVNAGDQLYTWQFAVNLTLLNSVCDEYYKWWYDSFIVILDDRKCFMHSCPFNQYKCNSFNMKASLLAPVVCGCCMPLILILFLTLVNTNHSD